MANSTAPFLPPPPEREPQTAEEVAAWLKQLVPGVRVTSGRRTREENARLPGASPRSMHLTDDAIDFVPPKGMPARAIRQRIAAAGRPITEWIDRPHGTGPHVHWGWRRRSGTPQPSENRWWEADVAAAEQLRAVAAPAPAPAIGAGTDRLTRPLPPSAVGDAVGSAALTPPAPPEPIGAQGDMTEGPIGARAPRPPRPQSGWSALGIDDSWLQQGGENMRTAADELTHGARDMAWEELSGAADRRRIGQRFDRSMQDGVFSGKSPAEQLALRAGDAVLGPYRPLVAIAGVPFAPFVGMGSSLFGKDIAGALPMGTPGAIQQASVANRAIMQGVMGEEPDFTSPATGEDISGLAVNFLPFGAAPKPRPAHVPLLRRPQTLGRHAPVETGRPTLGRPPSVEWPARSPQRSDALPSLVGEAATGELPLPPERLGAVPRDGAQPYMRAPEPLGAAPEALFARRKPEPGRKAFYSALEDSVAAVKVADDAPKAAKFWSDEITRLQQKGFIKAEELKDKGVKEWLDAQTEPVTKTQLLDHIKSQEQPWNTITLGGPPKNPVRAAEIDKEIADLRAEQEQFAKVAGDLDRRARNLGYDHPMANFFRQQHNDYLKQIQPRTRAIRDGIEALESQKHALMPPGVRHGEGRYSLSQQYGISPNVIKGSATENLHQLPNLTSRGFDPAKVEITRTPRTLDSDGEVRLSYGGEELAKFAEPYTLDPMKNEMMPSFPDEALHKVAREQFAKKDPPYYEGHWESIPDPKTGKGPPSNIAMHDRMVKIIDEKGRESLHIDEHQGLMYQQGHDPTVGWRGPIPPEKIWKAVEVKEPNEWALIKRDGTIHERYATKEEADAALEELKEEGPDLDNLGDYLEDWEVKQETPDYPYRVMDDAGNELDTFADESAAVDYLDNIRTKYDEYEVKYDEANEDWDILDDGGDVHDTFDTEELANTALAEIRATHQRETEGHFVSDDSEGGQWYIENDRGRRHGDTYYETEDAANERLQELRMDEADADSHQNSTVEHKPNAYWQPQDSTGRTGGKYDRNSYGDTAQAQAEEHARSLNQQQRGRGVPDAPYKSGWWKAAIKHPIEKAIQEGAENVSLSSGVIQAERYGSGDAIRQIDVTIDPSPQSKGKLIFIKASARAVNIPYTRTGKPKSVSLDDFWIQEWLGEDLVNRIKADMANRPKEDLDGPTLRVGKYETGGGSDGAVLKTGRNDFLRELYDSIIPKAIREYIKKWGGTLERTKTVVGKQDFYEVNVSRSHNQPMGEATTYQVTAYGHARNFDHVIKGRDDLVNLFGEDVAAEIFDGRNGLDLDQGVPVKLRRVNSPTVASTTITKPIWSFEIPEAMHNEIAEKGQAYYARQKANKGVASGPAGERVALGKRGVTAELAGSDLTRAEWRTVREAVRFINRVYPEGVANNTAAYRKIFDPKGVEVDGVAIPAHELVGWILGADDPLAAVKHEPIHILRRLKYITPDEWKILTDTATARKWEKRYEVDQTYADRPPEVRLEEAVAHHQQEWGRLPKNLREKLPYPVQRIFERIALLRRQLAAVFRKMFGAKATADDVLAAINSGAVKRRGPAKSPLVPSTSRAYAARAKGSVAKPEPVFYSALERGVEALNLPRASPEHWQKTLKGMPRVKQEEVAYTGVLDWLGEQKGFVSKDAVLDYIKAHKLELTEGVRGKDGNSTRFNAYQAVKETGTDYTETTLNLPKGYAAPSKDFVSPHFGDTGTVAHTRGKVVDGPNGEKVYVGLEKQSEMHQKGYSEGYHKPGEPEAGVPEAPFKASWLELGTKRDLRNAVDLGATEYFIPSGKSQMALYDLSEKFSSIGYKKTGDTYRIMALGRDGGSGSGVKIDVTPENLVATVGDRLAKRIMAGEGVAGTGSKWFSGDDLKANPFLGKLYDEKAPSTLRKYAQKQGWGDLKAKPMKIGDTDGLAFTITPEMAESIAGGQPLFARKKGGLRPHEERAVAKATAAPAAFGAKASIAKSAGGPDLQTRKLPSFWHTYRNLPEGVRRLADGAWGDFVKDYGADGLKFKKRKDGLWSYRLNDDWRVYGLPNNGVMEFIDIVPHTTYDVLDAGRIRFQHAKALKAKGLKAKGLNRGGRVEVWASQPS